MMQPVQSAQSRLSGEPGTLAAGNSPQTPITASQLKTLSQLISQLSALTGQAEGNLWILLRKDLQLDPQATLLARHFPGAEQNLSQRLAAAQPTATRQQLVNQITGLIGKNNHQPLSDYLTQQTGSNSLHSLNNSQLRTVLNLLQQGQLSQRSAQPLAQTPASSKPEAAIATPSASTQDLARLSPTQLTRLLSQLVSQGENQQLVNQYLQQHFYPQQKPEQTLLSLLTRQQQITLISQLLNGQLAAGTSPASQPHRPLTASELQTLNQLLLQTATATAQPPARLWQTMLSLTNASSPQQIAGQHFPALTNWLLHQQQYQQHLAQQPAPTLQQFSDSLNPPISAATGRQLADYAQQQWQLTPQTPLTLAQAQELLQFIARQQLQQILLPRHSQPIYNPLLAIFSNPVSFISFKPALAFAAMLAAIALFWLLS